MKRLTDILIFFFFLLHAFCQEMINAHHDQIIQILEKYKSDNSYYCYIGQTDSSVSLVIRDTSVQPVDVLFHFDDADKCDYIKRISSCDSCIKKYIQASLSNKNIKWTQGSDRMYVSQFLKKMVLEIEKSHTEYAYVIRRQEWSRKDYDALVGR